MNWLETNYLSETKHGMWSLALLLVLAVMSVAPRSSAQAMQKGISVQLAPTSSAVPVPDADKQGALIVTVSETGKLYLGIDLVASDSLAEKLKDRVSHGTVYIKADARAPYASVVKVFDVARAAGVVEVTLLTNQPKATQEGTVVLPEGIEMKLAPRSPAE